MTQLTALRLVEEIRRKINNYRDRDVVAFWYQVVGERNAYAQAVRTYAMTCRS